MSRGTKEKILFAAFEIFSNKGYAKSTTKEIASAAGVSEITIFRHFQSKEKLFEEVLVRFSFLPELKEILFEIQKLHIKDALILIGLRFFKTLKKKKNIIKIMCSEVNIYPEKILKIHENIIEQVDELLGDIFKEKIKIEDKFEQNLYVKAFLGMIFSYFQQEEIIKGKNIPEDEMKRIVEIFVKIFLNGVLNE